MGGRVMKAIGYITVFCFLIMTAHYLASTSPENNVELALFFGAMIPIIMAVCAGLNGDWD
jgi:hypothetical protein